jgi:hypothetical protein
MKNIICRRFYPVYYGKTNTYRSYKSLYVTDTSPRKGTADFLYGTCDDTVINGWISGINGKPVRFLSWKKALQNIKSFIKA